MKTHRLSISIVAVFGFTALFLLGLPQIAHSKLDKIDTPNLESLRAQFAPDKGIGAVGIPPGHSRTVRQLTGPDAQLRNNVPAGVAGGPCIRYEIQPVNPYPGGGTYPIGTTIGANSITLPGGSAQRVWLEVRISNWACAGTMKTWQATLGPEASLPPGIVQPDQSCLVDADCTAAGYGPDTGIPVNPTAGCGASAAPAGFCSTVFQQQPPEQPTAMNFDIEPCNSGIMACGATQINTPPLADTGGVRYAMTSIVEVTAGFAGSATIVFQNPDSDTFFQEGNDSIIPIGELVGATIVGCDCNGDVNGNGFVNFTDLSLIVACFGGPPCDPDADVNCDGFVDHADLGVALHQFRNLPGDGCDVPTGACCQEGGTCLHEQQSFCNGDPIFPQFSGVYQGDGTTCDPNPCAPPEPGRCCFNIGPGSTQCIDGIVSSDCNSQPPPQLFTAGATCAQGCPECVNNAQCTDGAFCNGDEDCVGGQCQASLVRDCEDGNPCTIDTCDENNDVCNHDPDQACLDDTGACCNRTPSAGGACTNDVRPDQCTGLDRFWTRDALCSQVTCQEIGGACCNMQTGNCVSSLVNACQGANQVWTREATCAQVACDPPPISCCLPNGACDVLPISICQSLAGVQVPACLGDNNGNSFDDACDSDCDQDGILNLDEADNNQKDCNNNNICDGLETLPDCDGNDVPDPCQPDCNNNNVADPCDIANCGVSNPGLCDTNNNGKPDVCDPDCDGDGIPNDLDPDGCPSDLGACCYEPSGNPVCFMTNRVNCEDWFGGIWDPLGDCTEITDAVEINEGGTIFYHRVNSEEHCMPPGGQQQRAHAGCSGAVFDPWISRPGAGAMCQDFGAGTGPTIPAGFFGPGSDPFTGIICYRGVPLGLSQFGLADTLISRSGDPFPRCSLPSVNEVNKFVLISALHMEGTAPIQVTYGGGSPELWNVDVGLSSVAPPFGELAARKTHCNGGTYTVSLNGQAKFIFTRVSDGTALPLDTGEMGMDPITLTSPGPMPWVHDTDPRFLLIADECTDFHPGNTAVEPENPCDCNGNNRRDKCDIEDGISQDCNGNGRPDSCEVFEATSEDCDGNGMPDECQPDCQPNGVIDACDLIAGTSVDENIPPNTIPDECERGVLPPSADSLKKNRYLSFRPGGSSGGGAAPVLQALRITSTSPGIPNGWFKWVTAPDANRISGLGCTPHHRAWGFGMLHVTGRDILPNKTYVVQGIALGGNTNDEVHYSKPPASVLTSEKFGDIKAPFGGDGQPNFVDIEACVDTFRVRPNALPVPVADIAPETPDKTVNFVDIEALVKAFRTFPYPYGGPVVCPP